MDKKNLIMGRADVLLRFLQLIGKDGPDDLDPFLKDLDCESEERPLVDQIVDRIIAGDETLYDKYAQARKDVGSRNPYSSPDDKSTKYYEEALGFFISRWSKLEEIMRNRAEQKLDRKDPLFRSKSQMWWRFRDIGIPASTSREIDSIRRLRNQVVHGAEAPPPDRLMSAGKFTEEILKELGQWSEVGT